MLRSAGAEKPPDQRSVLVDGAVQIVALLDVLAVPAPDIFGRARVHRAGDRERAGAWLGGEARTGDLGKAIAEAV